ncbi:MAG: hypothetical protein ABEJ56_06615 [Candidatus Nanohaloarchaea archaeon]
MRELEAKTSRDLDGIRDDLSEGLQDPDMANVDTSGVPPVDEVEEGENETLVIYEGTSALRYFSENNGLGIKTIEVTPQGDEVVGSFILTPGKAVIVDLPEESAGDPHSAVSQYINKVYSESGYLENSGDPDTEGVADVVTRATYGVMGDKGIGP